MPPTDLTCNWFILRGACGRQYFKKNKNIFDVVLLFF